MKILLKKTIIDLQILKDLKTNKHEITYNETDHDIDIIINDNYISFKHYPDFTLNYTHWINKDTDLSFVIGLLEETLLELNCYVF